MSIGGFLARVAARWPAALFAALAMTLVAGPAAAERIERHIKVGGMTRDYIAYIPSGAGRGAPVSVIMAFHPGAGSASGFEDQTLLHRTPGAQDFVIVYPDGYRRSWNAGDCCGSAKDRNIDDVGFVRAIFDDLEQFVHVHPTRNFATGFSNGGIMSHELACRMSDRFAAIAVAAGTRDFHLPCRPGRPISVLIMHGLEDEFSPFAGGQSKRRQAPPRPSAQSNLDYWVGEDRCNAPRPVTMLGSVTCQRYTGCAGGANVVFCPIPGMGHYWPGQHGGAVGKFLGRMILGPPRPELNASAEVIAFFRGIR